MMRTATAHHKGICMKLGRNEPCPCGSGEKYKRCCMDAISQQQAALLDDAQQILAMNPDLTLDELNVVMQRHMEQRNNAPLDEFFGLSPNQIGDWMHGNFDDWQGFRIEVPTALDRSPVLRYLTLMFEEALQHDGVIKTTAKGNLSAKLVKQASDLLPEFAVSAFERHISISEFAGINEDKFNALHYTRVLAEVCGLIYVRKGALHVKKTALQQYQRQGIAAFFKPMLAAMLSSYNWAYLDGFEQDVDLRPFWIFMLWRLHIHQQPERLTDEMITAFPPLLDLIQPVFYATPPQMLHLLIESRFIERFLQFWGFVTLDPRRPPLLAAHEPGTDDVGVVESAVRSLATSGEISDTAVPATARSRLTLQPLFTQSFRFSV